MILVTGASGFIGSHLVAELVRRGIHVRAAVRSQEPALKAPVETAIVGDLSGPIHWQPVLDGVDVVVHLAARAHLVRDRGAQVESVYHAINADATRALAEASAASGVRRLVFLSSSKVLGEETPLGRVWREDTQPAPVDPYGRSKLAAEQALGQVSSATGLEVVILRPPVVYGPGVRANIFELFRLVDRGVPLPLGLVQNRRSFVFVGNLVDAIIRVVGAPSAAGQVFHVCDGVPVSTATLVSAIGRALDRPVRLLPVPPGLLRLAGRAGDLVERLTRIGLPVNSDNVIRLVSSLVLDDSKIRTLQHWQNPISMDAGLAATATWYRTIATTVPTGRRIAGRRGRESIRVGTVKVPLADYRHLAAEPDPRAVPIAREPVFKRPLDVVLAVIGLLLTAPLWAMVALAIFMDDGPPIFFRQPRIGRGGTKVWILKFRSMMRNPHTVEVQASRNDPRITRVGRVLRRTTLDELPQLWNIFIGEMSFVGPRAQPEKEIVRADGATRDLYMREVPGFTMRQLVRPGLTGIAQLFAPREVPHRQKFRYDLIYVKKILRNSAQRRGAISTLKGDLELLWLDAGLVLRSAWIALRGKWEV